MLVRPDSPAAERFAKALSRPPPSSAKSPVPLIDIFETEQRENKAQPADGPERKSTGQVDEDHATEASKSDKLCAELNLRMHLVGDEACRHGAAARCRARADDAAWHADLSHGIIPTRGSLGISRLFVFFQGSKMSPDMLSTRLLLALTDIKVRIEPDRRADSAGCAADALAAVSRVFAEDVRARGRRLHLRPALA